MDWIQRYIKPYLYLYNAIIDIVKCDCLYPKYKSGRDCVQYLWRRDATSVEGAARLAVVEGRREVPTMSQERVTQQTVGALQHDVLRSRHLVVVVRPV